MSSFYSFCIVLAEPFPFPESDILLALGRFFFNLFYNFEYFFGYMCYAFLEILVTTEIKYIL